MRPLLLALLLAAPAGAAETAAFLDVGPGARAVGLGGAYTALADDSDALYWNPAGLARQEKRQASFSHAELGRSNRHEYVSYAQPAGFATFGAALTYVDYGTLEGRDATGARTADYHASDAALAFGAAAKSELADFGASLKYVRSHIASAEAQGVAVDAGARRELPLPSGKLVLAAALRNLGPGLKYQDRTDDLPLRAAFGAAYRFGEGHALAAEFQNGPRGAGCEGGAGAEFTALEGVLLRVGYTSKSAASGGSGFDAARGLTVGFGLRRGGFSLDYGAQAAGELGNTHHFTVAAKF